MSRYAVDDEERIRHAALVREWTRSGLLTAPQGSAMEASLRTGLKRTNRSLRAGLFIFGTIVVWAGLGFCLAAFGVSDVPVVAWSAIVAGGVCLLLAELLVLQFRLYRFGVEEAFAVWSVLLLAGGAGLLVSIGASRDDLAIIVGLLIGALGSVVVYLRFGYLYAALAAAGWAALWPFFLSLPHAGARLLSASILAVIVAVAARARRGYDDDFPGDDYGSIQAAASLGIYAALNLHLLGDLRPVVLGGPGEVSLTFYWGTYVAIWLLPVATLAVALRRRHRALIWAGLLMSLATLSTHKPYLGWALQTWDPILLGLLLTGTAIVVRRWLSRGPDGQRHGFLAQRILESDRDALTIVGRLGGVAQPSTAHLPRADPSPFEPGGGGRSGGGGGGAEY
jgi:hypothetical protein